MIHKDYTYLINDGYFTERQIHSKMKTCYTLCENLIHELQHGSKSLYTNDALLEMAVCDYYADLARLKPFHEIKTVDAVKQIAYISFWLMRCAPIQILNNSCDILFANEMLVISLFFTECKKLVGGELVVPQSLKLKKFGAELFYYYRYRHYTQQSIEHAMSAFLNGMDFILK